MEGPQPVTLAAVLVALRAIGAIADTERSAPTKQVAPEFQSGF
jgi:hypothetical protein